MIILDTNIFIEIYRGNKKISDIVSRIGQEDIAITDVTRAELFYGARNKSELATIRKNLENLETIHINANISKMAVDLVEQFSLSHKLDLEDALIASSAIFYSADLYTLNLKDFIFIPNIKIFKP